MQNSSEMAKSRLLTSTFNKILLGVHKNMKYMYILYMLVFFKGIRAFKTRYEHEIKQFQMHQMHLRKSGFIAKR